jgi:hypothetical protein
MPSLCACASWWPSASSVTVLTPQEQVKCVLWLVELQSLMGVQRRFRMQYVEYVALCMSSSFLSKEKLLQDYCFFFVSHKFLTWAGLKPRRSNKRPQDVPVGLYMTACFIMFWLGRLM